MARAVALFGRLALAVAAAWLVQLALTSVGMPTFAAWLVGAVAFLFVWSVTAGPLVRASSGESFAEYRKRASQERAARAEAAKNKRLDDEIEIRLAVDAAARHLGLLEDPDVDDARRLREADQAEPG